MEFINFNSMYELGQSLDKPNDHKHKSSHKTDRFYGEMSMDDCKRACENGGRSDNAAERLNALMHRLPAHGLAPMDQISLAPAINGFMPMIPEYIAGEPEQMMTAAFAPRDTPTREIVINVSASARVEPAEILGRAAAVVHLVEEMELKGIRCGITVGARFKEVNYRTDEVDFDVQTRVRVKHPEDVFHRDTATLCLGSTEMLRRLFFNILEGSEEFKANPSGTYGSPKEIYHEESDLYITGCYDAAPTEALRQIRENLGI